MIDTNRSQQLERALHESGDTHTLADILTMISRGECQSFVEGETWAVTTIVDTPRKRVVEIFLVIGDMEDAVKLHDQVEEWARGHGAHLLRTIARKGWAKQAKLHGWTNGHDVFLKELV